MNSLRFDCAAARNKLRWKLAKRHEIEQVYKLPQMSVLNDALTAEYYAESCTCIGMCSCTTTYRVASMRIFETGQTGGLFMDEWSMPYNPVFLLVAAVHLNGTNPKTPLKSFPWFSSCLEAFSVKDDELTLFLINHETIVVNSKHPLRLHYFNDSLQYCWSSTNEECICHYVPISCCLVRMSRGCLIFEPYFPTFNRLVKCSISRNKSLMDFYNDFLYENFDIESANRSWLRSEDLPNQFWTTQNGVVCLKNNIKIVKNYKNIINPYKNICFSRMSFDFGSFVIPHKDFSFVYLFESARDMLFAHKNVNFQYFVWHGPGCNCDLCPRNFVSYPVDYSDLETDLEAQGLTDYLPGVPTIPLKFDLGESATEQIGALTEVLRELSENFSAKTTDLQGSFSGVIDFSKRMTIGLASAYVVYSALKAYTDGNFDNLNKVASSLPIVLAAFPIEISEFIMGCVSHLRNTELEAQIGGQGPIPWEQISILSLGAVHLFTTGAFGKKFDSMSLMKLVSMLPKATEGFMVVFDGFITVVKYCIEYVRVELLGFDPKNSDEKILYPRVVEWLSSVKDIVSSEKEGVLDVTAENFDRITRLQIVGMTIFKYDKFGKDSPAILNKVRYFMNLLDHIKKPFEQSCIKTDLCRVEPLTILIRGAPGTGKSAMIKPFVHQLLSQILPKDRLEELVRSPDSFVYNRQSEHEYWDGYRGQFVTIMDDFGQVVDVAGNPDNEFMSLIRGTNRFPYVLHMASLEDKGSNIFTSKIIICTTNMMTFQNVESIHDKEALIRRFDYIVDLDVKDEFSYIRSGDSGKKVRKDIKFDTDIWNFNIMEGVNVTNVGTINQQLSFDQFLNLCVRYYKVKENKLTEYNRYCKKELISAMRRRAIEESSSAEVPEWLREFDDMQPKQVEFVDAVDDNIPEEMSEFDFSISTWKIVENFFNFGKNDWYNYCDPISGYARMRDYLLNLGPNINNFIERLSSMNFYDYVSRYINHSITFFSDMIVKCSKKIVDVISKYPLLTTLTTLCTFGSAFYAISSIFSIEAAGLYKSRKAAKKVVMGIKSGTRTYTNNNNIIFEPQGPVIDQNADQLATKICKKNILLLCLPGCNTIKSGTVLMLSGGVGLMPNHYLEIIQSR